MVHVKFDDEDPEENFARYIEVTGLPAPVRQYRFHPVRRWKADFAWPDRKLLVEIEGGTWTGGRHVRGKGFADDCEKYNEAALMGYRVLRFTPNMVDDGVALEVTERALGYGRR